MHTFVIVICGFVLSGIFVAFGWLWHMGTFPSEFAMKMFIVVWAVISLANMWIGVSKAGYSFGEELSILPYVLLPPILVAGFVLLLW